MNPHSEPTVHLPKAFAAMAVRTSGSEWWTPARWRVGIEIDPSPTRVKTLRVWLELESLESSLESQKKKTPRVMCTFSFVLLTCAGYFYKLHTSKALLLIFSIDRKHFVFIDYALLTEKISIARDPLSKNLGSAFVLLMIYCTHRPGAVCPCQLCVTNTHVRSRQLTSL